MIIDVPDTKPLTTPVAEIVAIVGLLLVQIPPEVVLTKVDGNDVHNEVGPVIAGSEFIFIVTGILTEQPDFV